MQSPRASPHLRCRAGAPPLRGSLPPEGADLARGGPSLRLFLAWVAASLLLLAAPAHAEIWGYVDPEGVSHFASSQVDSRYELFYLGGEAPLGVPAAQVVGAVNAPPSVAARFDVSPDFKAVRHLVREAAKDHGLPFELLQAVIATESGFNARAVSPKGAVGLMQLMPDTAQRFGVRSSTQQTLEQRLTDPRTNVQAGARYLAWLLKHFNGELELAIAAYNAGEGAVQRAGRKVPNYPETRNYVRKVTQLHQNLLPPRAVSEARAAAVSPAAMPPRRGRWTLTAL